MHGNNTDCKDTTSSFPLSQPNCTPPCARLIESKNQVSALIFNDDALFCLWTANISSLRTDLQERDEADTEAGTGTREPEAGAVRCERIGRR